MGSAFKRGILFCLIFFSAKCLFALVAVPELSNRVMDLTGSLSSATLESLDRKLKDFEASKGSQVAVLIVPTTEPEAIEQYSIRVVDRWKLGRKKADDGVLLLIAKQDRTMRIEVGYGLEGALTDLMSKRIISDIISPRFKSGDFEAGIAEGIAAILTVIQGEALSAPDNNNFSKNTTKSKINPGSLFVLLFFACFILRMIFGKVFGGILSGGLTGAGILFFMGSMIFGVVAGLAVMAFVMSSNSRNGGWSSGGGFGSGFGGGGGWGGGGGGGGFSGGGGSFGGGGASGSW